MICERCYRPLEDGEHGLYKCPLEARRQAPVVWQDTIEGGRMIEHGLCHEDGSPKRYDSRTDIKDACRAKGLIPWGEIWEERRTQDGREYNNWLKSGEAQRRRTQRIEERIERARAKAARMAQ